MLSGFPPWRSGGSDRESSGGSGSGSDGRQRSVFFRTNSNNAEAPPGPPKSSARTQSSSSTNDLDCTSHKKRGGGILASDADVRMPETQFAAGCTLLLAAARGDVAMVERVLKQNPQITVNFRDYDRRTAVHVASSEGHLDLVKYLVQHGAVVNRSDRWGGSPLDDAHRHRHGDVARFLRDHGAKTGSSDAAANLISAANEGDLDEVAVLVDHCDVDVNRGDYDQRTALHLAAGNNHVKIVEFLLDRGANVNCEDKWGGRPLDDAIRNKAVDCQIFLESHGGQKGSPLIDRQSSAYLDDIGPDPDLDIDFDELEMIERIGQGAFGEIYKCRWRGTLVAAKCIRSAKITKEWAKAKQQEEATKQRRKKKGAGAMQVKREESATSAHNDDDDNNNNNESGAAGINGGIKTVPSEDALSKTTREQALMDFRIEVAILKKLRHPNICMLLAYSTTEDFEVVVSELMRCSLMDVFKANSVHNTQLTTRNQIVYAQQIAQGINYLHTCKPPIIHRDIKPANLLIDYTGTLKITDFGLAKVRSDPTDQEADMFTMTGETGTYRFMAPEVFRHEQYNEKVDVYSYAMILFMLFAGHPPWPMLSGVAAASAAALEGRRPAIPRAWDSRLCNLLQQCWDENPSARPGFRDILPRLNEYSRDVLGTKTDSVVVAQSDNRCSCTIS